MINENLLNASGYALDCSNAESLDSSVKSSVGISGGISESGDEIFYNSNNKTNAYYGSNGEIDPEMIKVGLQTATALAQGRAAQGVCKRPLVRETPFNRKRWEEYNSCLAREERQKQRELEIAKARASMNRGDSGVSNFGDDNKVLGMPKSLAIGLGVVLGLAVAGFVVYKVVKAKKD